MTQALKIGRFLLLAALAFSSLRADTVTLKSGEKLEGKITGDTDASITMDVQISSSITDERTIPKEEIQSVEKLTPEDIAYADIKDLAPGDTSFAAETYEKIIQQLQSFLNQFPASARFAEIQSKVKAFQDEESKVNAGGFKMKGKWLTKEEAIRRKYQIEALLLFHHMEEVTKTGDLIGAMNIFDSLEKQYGGSRSYPDAVELARQIVSSLGREVDQAIPQFQQSEQNRLNGLKLTSEPQKSQLIAAAQAEENRDAAAIAAAQKEGLKWPPLISRSLQSLTAIKALCLSESQRLALVPLENIRKSIAILDQAIDSIHQKQWDKAKTQLQQASTVWAANHAVAVWTKVIVDEKAKIAALATPTPKPTPKPVTHIAAVSTPVSTEEDSKPFFQTVRGAFFIVIGVLVVIGGIAVIGKLQKPKEDES